MIGGLLLSGCTATESAPEVPAESSPTPAAQEAQLPTSAPDAATSGLADPAAGEASEPAEAPFPYTISTTLRDVTDGATLYGGYTTNPDSTGEARAGYDGEDYRLETTFENMPLAGEDAFYEGWIVTPDGSSVISTGELVREAEGMYSNAYSDTTDLTDHTLYVLTLEPRDGDPAPAEHVLEGTMR